jgi:hypothetical protein
VLHAQRFMVPRLIRRAISGTLGRLLGHAPGPVVRVADRRSPARAPQPQPQRAAPRAASPADVQQLVRLKAAVYQPESYAAERVTFRPA